MAILLIVLLPPHIVIQDARYFTISKVLQNITTHTWLNTSDTMSYRNQAAWQYILSADFSNAPHTNELNQMP